MGCKSCIFSVLYVSTDAYNRFRWATCQLDSLAGCPSSKAIKAALACLPRDLNKTYERMLHNIPKDIRSSTVCLLQFLVRTHRPLTVLEAVEILATDTEAEPPRFDVGGRLFGDEDVLRHAPSLVSIVEVTGYRGRIKRNCTLLISR